jgi:hypothetical protein
VERMGQASYRAPAAGGRKKTKKARRPAQPAPSVTLDAGAWRDWHSAPSYEEQGHGMGGDDAPPGPSEHDRVTGSCGSPSGVSRPPPPEEMGVQDMDVDCGRQEEVSSSHNQAGPSGKDAVGGPDGYG